MKLASLMTAGVTGCRRPKKPNILMLMTDDTGWNDFGYYNSTK